MDYEKPTRRLRGFQSIRISLALSQEEYRTECVNGLLIQAGFKTGAAYTSGEYLLYDHINCGKWHVLYIFWYGT